MTNEELHDFRKEIDRLIQKIEAMMDAEVIKHQGLPRPLNFIRAVESVITKLSEAEMWTGKVLEARGLELPKELRDKFEEGKKNLRENMCDCSNCKREREEDCEKSEKKPLDNEIIKKMRDEATKKGSIAVYISKKIVKDKEKSTYLSASIAKLLYKNGIEGVSVEVY